MFVQIIHVQCGNLLCIYLLHTAGLQDDDCSVVLAISPSSLTTPPGTSAEPPTPPKETMTPVQKDEVASLTCALEDLSISVVDIPKKSVDTEAQSAESVSCSTSPCKSKTKSTATVVKFRLSRSNCVLQVLADSSADQVYILASLNGHN